MEYEGKFNEPSYPGEPMVSVWESSSDEEDLAAERKRAKDKKSTQKQARHAALAKHPRSDADVCSPPDDVNNKATERAHLKDKLRGIFKSKTPKSPPMLDHNQPVATPSLGVATDDEEPPGAPVRFVPPIAPMEDFSHRKSPVDFCRPVGGDVGAFIEADDAHLHKRRAIQNEVDLRSTSDQRRKPAGRQHFADSKIDRTPQLSRRAITEHTLRGRSPELRRREKFAEPTMPIIIEADAQKVLPAHDDPAHDLDAFMSYNHTARSQEGHGQVDEEISPISMGSPTEILHSFNGIGVSSGFPCALAKVDSGYHSVFTQFSVSSSQKTSSVSSTTSGSRRPSRTESLESHPDYTIQPIHPEPEETLNKRKGKPIPDEEKGKAIDSTTKALFGEDYVGDRPLTPPETPRSLPLLQRQRTATAEKKETKQTKVTERRAGPISMEVDHPTEAAPEKKQSSGPLQTKLPSRTKPALEINTNVSTLPKSGEIIYHDGVHVERYGCLNVYKPSRTIPKTARTKTLISGSGSGIGPASPPIPLRPPPVVHAEQSIAQRNIRRGVNGNEPAVPLIDPKWQRQDDGQFSPATSPLKRTPLGFDPDANPTKIRHKAYEVAIARQLREDQLKLANSYPLLPLVSQHYCATSNSAPREKTNHRSAGSHVIHPPSRSQTSPVNSGNLHHFKHVLKTVGSSESLVLGEESVHLPPDSHLSAGRKEILPSPRQLLDDNNALGIINLTDFPQPPTFRESRKKSPQLSQPGSKQSFNDFVFGNTEQVKDLLTPPPPRNVGIDGLQTQNLVLRSPPLITLSESGQERLSKQKEAASVHGRLLRAVSDSESLSSESQPYELTPSVAKRTRQRNTRAEKSQEIHPSGITKGSPASLGVDLSPSQNSSRGPQQNSPSNRKFTLHPSSGLGLKRLVITDSTYLEWGYKVQKIVTKLPPPPSDSLPNPEVVSTHPKVLPPLTEATPGGTSSSSAQQSFLDNRVAASRANFAEMDRLQIRKSQTISVRAKAVEDARQMQASVLEAAAKAGKDPPKYVLLELTGKGSFGRVYKAKDMASAAIVAVKIIDIDESDTINPKNADSYSEFLKEISALKTLSESKARNINHVIEALPVGQAMWMITEYCGGGSVATLMKPTAPGGLQEKWIIPILREVAEAIKWVHDAGIIHRDIKCANVLVTEEGGVQLCDFGVAGTMETKVDKRSTIIGTPHWMAPELFDATPSYGKEVDIWAFGSMVYEIATGLPPNAANRIPFERLGPYLKQHVPRLEGGDYSDDLRSLVAYCLEEFPSERPTIDQVQMHPYIYNTQARYPTSSLSHLVRAFKLWEDHGGSRKSLFMMGGAQGPSEYSSTAISDDEWNFSTTAAFDQEVRRQSTAQDVYDVYGSGVDFDAGFVEQTSKPPPAQKGRRRPPPEALAPLKAPLEKIFDPNTLSNYEENSRNHYGRPFAQPTSDLPLRDDSAQTSIRDTMIDLGGHDVETGISNFPDMETIKAGRYGRDDPDDDYTSTLPDFSRPALSDPADINPNRRTQDWKFPSMAPPASADPELSRFPSSYEVPRPAFTPGSGGRPALVHHPTEPLGSSFGGGFTGATQTAMDRMSVRESLIDLDMSLPDPLPEFARPSTAQSDNISISSERTHSLTSSTVNPFELEHHASLYQPTHEREPSIYVTEDFAASSRHRTGNALNDLADVSDFSVSDAEGNKDDASDTEYIIPSYHPHIPDRTDSEPQYTMAHFPDLPPAPSIPALTGEASQAEMKHEVTRMLASLTGQLSAFRDVYDSPVVARRPSRRRQPRGDGENGA